EPNVTWEAVQTCRRCSGSPLVCSPVVGPGPATTRRCFEPGVIDGLSRVNTEAAVLPETVGMLPPCGEFLNLKRVKVVVVVVVVV
ncbi:unnamed protein product, partial [Gadus morhua 'NCC']